MNAYLGLLRQPEVRRIFWGAIPARLAYAMVGLVLFFFVKDLTGSLTIAGLAIGANSFASSSTAGLRGGAVDRWGQTTPLLVLVPLYSATLAMLGLISLSSSWTIALCALNGLLAPPINMSTRPLFKLAVRPDQIRTAWALDSVVLNATMVVGPVVATGLCLQVSPGFGLLTTGVLMLVGGTMLLTSPLSRRWRGEERVPGAPGIMRSRAMWVLACEGIAIGLAFGALDVAVPSSASLHHHAGRAAPMLALFAIGGIVGGIWAGANSKRIGSLRGLWCSTLTAAVCLLPLPFTTPGPSMGVLLLLSGVAMGPAQVFWLELVDVVRPRGTAVSAMGWLWAIEGSVAAVGSALAGRLADTHGATAALSVVGAAALLSPVALLTGRRFLTGTQQPAPTAPDRMLVAG